MHISDSIMLLLIGAVGGFLSGFLGIGGGVILIPLLIYLGEYSIKDATAVSVVFIIFASISGILGHKKNINLEIGIWIGISSIVGTFSVAFLNNIISDRMLNYFFGVVVFLSAFMLLFPTARERQTDLDNIESESIISKRLLAVFIGLLKGSLTGLLGVGGGFIVVPLMIYCLKMRTLAAVGTSLLITLISGICATISKTATLKTIEISSITWIVLGAIISAQIGAWLAYQVKPALIRKILFMLLLLIFVRLAWDAL